MTQTVYLTEAEHDRVSNAVTAAERHTAGEIVTIIADRSDGYSDVAMAWSAMAALAAVSLMAIFPDFYLGLYERLSGGWVQEWTPRNILGLAAGVSALKFIGVYLFQFIKPVKFFLIPGKVKSLRVHDRAVSYFKVGAERRTHGRTGILIYLSMSEHRAEIVADEAIANKVPPTIWGDAMQAMLAHIKKDEVAEGMVAAVERVGAVLADHFPRGDVDHNELPDRLIEI